MVPLIFLGYSGCHWKVYECSFMKQNCHFQRGVSQYKNAIMPLINLEGVHKKRALVQNLATDEKCTILMK